MNEQGGLTNPVDIAWKKFEDHPSIRDIKENVSIAQGFSFSKVTPEEMILKIKALNVRKSGTFMNIPAIILK